MKTITIGENHARAALSEILRYTLAYEKYAEKGEFESLEMFLEFSSNIETLKAVITELAFALGDVPSVCDSENV